MARRPPVQFISNADQPSLSEVMSDPGYLEQSRQMRQYLRFQQELAKRQMGFRDPRRGVQDEDHLGFAEGIFSADEGITPATGIPINPKFRR